MKCDIFIALLFTENCRICADSKYCFLFVESYCVIDSKFMYFLLTYLLFSIDKINVSQHNAL